MLKNISNLGKTLNKSEQQSIKGGKNLWCYKYFPCINEYLNICEEYIEPCPS